MVLLCNNDRQVVLGYFFKNTVWVGQLGGALASRQCSFHGLTHGMLFLASGCSSSILS